MTEYTDEDVAAVAEVLSDTMRVVFCTADVKDILNAVLPEYTRRKRLEWEHDEACGGLPLVEHDRALSKWVRAEALREAADEIDGDTGGVIQGFTNRIRAIAAHVDAEEADDE